MQDDAWKMDRIPEIMDGKNVADYVDQDIDAKLALLEQEEDQLQVQPFLCLFAACIIGVAAAAAVLYMCSCRSRCY